MSDTKSAIEASAEVLRLSIRFLRQHELVMSPVNYAVVYTHLSGAHPVLSARIHGYIEENVEISSSLLAELYLKYLATELVLPVLGRKEQMTQEVMDVVSEVMTALTSMDSTTKTSQANLVAQHKTLTGPVPLDTNSTKTVIVRLVEETKRLLTASALLHKDLERTRNDVCGLQSELARHKDAAITDPLTGLLNRRGFDSRITSMIGLCDKKNVDCAFILLDIDHFKKINDTFGHAGGDAMLKAIAELLRFKTRGEDLIVRWGGEEFLVVLPETSTDKAHIVVENIRKQIEQLAVLTAPKTGQPYQVTLSAGVHGYRPGKNMVVTDVIDCADKALYEAKTTGRNKTCLYFS